jgi:hypothetical protein
LKKEEKKRCQNEDNSNVQTNELQVFVKSPPLLFGQGGIIFVFIVPLLSGEFVKFFKSAQKDGKETALDDKNAGGKDQKEQSGQKGLIDKGKHVPFGNEAEKQKQDQRDENDGPNTFLSHHHGVPPFKV